MTPHQCHPTVLYKPVLSLTLWPLQAPLNRRSKTKRHTDEQLVHGTILSSRFPYNPVVHPYSYLPSKSSSSRRPAIPKRLRCECPSAGLRAEPGCWKAGVFPGLLSCGGDAAPAAVEERMGSTRAFVGAVEPAPVVSSLRT